MIILFKIAFRNIIANKRRSVLIGVAVFFSSLIMLILSSVMNGAEVQTLKGYINIQSGNVAVVWKDLKEVSNMDPGRLFGYNSFDVDEDSLNKTATAELNKYIDEHRDEIKNYFPTIRRGGSMHAGENLEDGLVISSLSTESGNLLTDTGTLEMDKGVLLSEKDYGICISREIADNNKINFGDTVSLSVMSPYGANNILDFVVTGIFANSAGYNNGFVFISEKNAEELYDYDLGYFDIGRIYLKKPDDSARFAHDLDEILLKSGGVLRAESSAEASAFYTNISGNTKNLYNIFIIFLLIMIAIGLRATIKMNLFERMKEFGTIRAIGFSRLQNYSIIFFEIFFLSVIILMLALSVSGIFVLIFGNTGIYVGTGPQSYSFGGESFYPKMLASDVMFTFIVMIIFSLFSTFSPGMKICFQKITDLLIKRQRKVYLIGVLFKRIFGFAS